jgi:hypothetical protein
MLFNDDEGTENGGMLFGGNRSADGQFHSYGHLSFDGYEQDQSMSLDSNQDGDERTTAYQINDNIGDTLFTPEVMAGFAALHAMPEGPAKQKAIADFKAKYPTPCAPEPHSNATPTNPPSSVSAILTATPASCCASPPTERPPCSSSTPPAK